MIKLTLIDPDGDRLAKAADVEVLMIAVEDLNGLAERGRPQTRYRSLVSALEVGEIDPVGALGSLPPTDADLVRRVALGALRRFRALVSEEARRR